MKFRKLVLLSGLTLFSGLVFAGQSGPSPATAIAKSDAHQTGLHSSASTHTPDSSGPSPHHQTPVMPALAPKPEWGLAGYLMSRVLTETEYAQKPLDQKLSTKIFDLYFKSLDGAHMYLLKEDVDKYRKFDKSVGTMIKKVNLRMAYSIYELYRKRVNERYQYALSLLEEKKPFDFSIKEELDLDRTKTIWAANRDELDDLWRRKLKNDWLRLKLAGKSDKDIADLLKKRYVSNRRQLLSFDSEHVAELFLNAYATSIDPHTNYMSPTTARDFQIEMSLALEGIDALLQQSNGYAMIREVVAGGPARGSGKLHPGDKIIAVGQGVDGPMEDVIDWRLDEIVKKIRGERGTVVRIEVIPAVSGVDGKSKTVSLVRDKALMEDQAARLKTYEVSSADDKKMTVGIIEIPGFYDDFSLGKDEKTSKNLASDVRNILTKLKDRKISAVVLDLRNDGGGSLRQAAALSGLFIGPNKPIVQVRDAWGHINNVNTPGSKLFWDKPVVVMVNRFSASASEIFAGVIKDYRRGVIVGDTTWGKGSVQTMVLLNDMVTNMPQGEELGSLKMTVQQFFRVNGSSTQIKGITPDIQFPSSFNHSEIGESSYDNAITWSKIPAAKFQKFDLVSDSVLRILNQRHDARTKASPSWKLFEDETNFTLERSNEKKVSLNLTQRQEERKSDEAMRDEFERRRRELGESDIEVFKLDDGLAYGEGDLKADLADEKRRKETIDTSAREASQIALDLLKLTSDGLDGFSAGQVYDQKKEGI